MRNCNTIIMYYSFPYYGKGEPMLGRQVEIFPTQMWGDLGAKRPVFLLILD